MADGEDYEFSIVGLTLSLKIVWKANSSALFRSWMGRRRYCILRTRVQEIKDYGQPDSQSPDRRGHGYIAAPLQCHQSLEPNGGVCIELETIALSRIFQHHPLVTKPVVEHVSELR